VRTITTTITEALGLICLSNHTISSAIKADYSQPNVKTKLNELNASVKRTRVVRTAPGVESALRSIEHKPFVVRKAEEQLIARKPELHDVMHDGLVLLRKNLKKATRKLKKSKRASWARCSSVGSTRQAWLDEPFDRSGSSKNVYSPNHYSTNSNNYFNETMRLGSGGSSPRPVRSPSRTFHNTHGARSRLSRSLSPCQFSRSLNDNLAQERTRTWPSPSSPSRLWKTRPRSSSASRSPARRTQDSAYGTLTDFYGGKYQKNLIDKHIEIKFDLIHKSFYFGS
jgi:hypothetical protein